MFQYAAENYNIEYDNLRAEDRDIILSYNKDKVLCKFNDGDVEYPFKKDICNVDESKLLYIFSIENQRFFLYLCDLDEKIKADGFDYDDVDSIKKVCQGVNQFAGVTGNHYYSFHMENKFCSKCGEKLNHNPQKRCMICQNCSNEVFPKISPAVIVGVIDEENDAILMTRYADRPYKKLALIAGFIEMGESAQQGVSREVMEEAGLEVEDIKFFDSQPWGFSQNLLIGFFAKVKGSRKIVMDQEELSEAFWQKRLDMDDDQNRMSLTGEMMWAFKNGSIKKR